MTKPVRNKRRLLKASKLVLCRDRLSRKLASNFYKRSFSVVDPESVLSKREVQALALDNEKRVQFGVFADMDLYPGMVFTSTKLFSHDLKYIGETIPADQRCILFYINEALVTDIEHRTSPVNVKFIEGCVVTLCFIAEGEQLFIDYGELYSEQRALEQYSSYADHPIERHALLSRFRWNGKNSPCNAHRRAWQHELRNT